MADNILQNIDAEIDRIQKSVAELTVRLNDLMTLRKLVYKYPKVVEAPVQLTVILEGSTAVERTEAAPNLTKRERIVKACREILADGHRRFAREMVGELANMGVAVGGKDPAANLASYLSHHSEIFHADTKAGGWTLRSLLQKERATDVGAWVALSSNGASGDHHPTAA